MNTEKLAQGWRERSEEVISGMREWREQHPKATFREIETALDERLSRLRAQMLQDTALASSQADWSQRPKTVRPLCPECGAPLLSRGKRTRHLQTDGGQELALERTYGTCPKCGGGVFPPGFQEELELGGGGGNLSPRLHEWLVRRAPPGALWAWVPFGQAAALLSDFARVQVSQTTTRRQTEVAGAAYEAIQTAEVEQIERTLPPVPRHKEQPSSYSQ